MKIGVFLKTALLKTDIIVRNSYCEVLLQKFLQKLPASRCLFIKAEFQRIFITVIWVLLRETYIIWNRYHGKLCKRFPGCSQNLKGAGVQTRIKGTIYT